MNDLEEVTRLRPVVALPMTAELADARIRLLEAIEAESAGRFTNPARERAEEVPSPSERHGRRRRLVVAGVVSIAAAATIFFAIPTTAPRSQPKKPAIDLTTARFLNRAANRIVNDAGPAPRPGQFVYSKTESPGGVITETWLSVDGSAEGLSRRTSGSAVPSNPKANALGPSCSISKAKATKCFPTVGYFPDLPTNPNAVLPYLNRIGMVETAGGPPSAAAAGWQDNVVGKAVSYLLSSAYLLSPQRAALYKLMAETPGFQIVPSMTDAIGRSGVGIEWTFEGGTAAVIFDPTTYAFLGSRTWPAGQPANPSAAYDGSALMKLAVVSRVGQQP